MIFIILYGLFCCCVNIIVGLDPTIFLPCDATVTKGIPGSSPRMTGRVQRRQDKHEDDRLGTRMTEQKKSRKSECLFGISLSSCCQILVREYPARSEFFECLFEDFKSGIDFFVRNVQRRNHPQSVSSCGRSQKAVCKKFFLKFKG